VVDATGSFIICHFPFGILSSSGKSMTFSKAAALCPKWQMKNVKWKMISDPVAAARGSDTLKLKLEL